MTFKTLNPPAPAPLSGAPMSHFTMALLADLTVSLDNARLHPAADWAKRDLRSDALLFNKNTQRRLKMANCGNGKTFGGC